MILTVTANASLDRILFIDEFVPTTNMRVQKNLEAVGGKGYDTSVALQCLGVPNLALGCLAGRSGEVLRAQLDGYGIRHDLIWVEGDTRIAHVIIETRHRRHSHITSLGYTLTAADVAELLARFRRHLPAARWVVVAGAAAPGAPLDLYRTEVELAQAAGVPVLTDCHSEPARLAAGARPAIHKMNRAELAATYGVRADTIADLERAVRDLARRLDLPAMVVTCGADGILAVTRGGSYLATVPHQEEVNAAGAGDAVSAALVWRLGEGDDWPAALQWAGAASAATVLTERTAESRIEDVRRLYPLVCVAVM
jgi:1-phosphofructokinase family hexose kinase